MSDLRALLERERREFHLPPDALERMMQRRDRVQRNRRIAAATVALAAVAAAGWLVVSAFERSAIGPRPAAPINPANVHRLRLDWVGPGLQSLSTAAVAGDTVLAISGEGDLVAFPRDCAEEQECDPLWSVPVGHGQLAFSGSGSDITAYAVRDKLYALQPSCFAGTPSSCVPRAVGRAPSLTSGGAVGDGLVFVKGSGRLYAFTTECNDPLGCTPVWEADIGARGAGSPVVVGGYVVVDTHDGLLALPSACARDGSKCEAAWTWTAPGAGPPPPDCKVCITEVIGDLAATENTLFVSVREGLYRSVYALPVACGSGGRPCEPLWRAGLPQGAGPPVTSAQKVFVGAYGGRRGSLYAFPELCRTDGDTCEPEWVGGLDSAVSPATPTVSGEVVYVPTFDGRLYAFRVDCGAGGATCQPSWVGQAGGTLSSPVTGDEFVYVGSDDGNLYAFSLGGAGFFRTRSGGLWTPVIYGTVLMVVVFLIVRSRLRRRL